MKSILEICFLHWQETLMAFLTYLPKVIFGVSFLKAMLHQKHSTNCIIVVLILKQVFYVTVYLRQIGEVYSSSQTYLLIAILLDFLFSAAYFFTLCYCFEENSIVILITSVVMDFLLAAVISFGMFLLETINGKHMNLAGIVYAQPVTWTELAEYYVLTAVPAFLALYSLRFLMKRWHFRNVPVNVFTAGLAIAFIVSGFFSYITLIKDMSHFQTGFLNMAGGVGVGALVVFLYLFFVQESKRLRIENQYLNRQHRMRESYLSEMQLQQEKKQAYWSAIEEQMQKMNAMQITQETEKTYLESLKQEYQRLKEMEVCQNFAVNALIEKENQTAKEDNLKIHWEIQDAKADEQMEQHIVCLMEMLCKEGIAKCKEAKQPYFIIRLAKHKAQWQLEMEIPAITALPSLREEKIAVKRWGGYQKIEKKKTGIVVKLLLPE